MIIVEKAEIRNEDKYLILLRSKTAKIFPEHWDFTGGTLEQGEDPRACLEREVFEETNLKVKALAAKTSFEMDLLNKGQNTHKFTIYSTKVISGDFKLSHEHLESKWATKEEILKLKIEPFLRQYLTKFTSQ